MTIEMWILGVNSILLLALVIDRFKKSSYIYKLEESVKIKKLLLSEKMLDSQMNGTGNLMEFLKQNAEQAQAEEDNKKEQPPIKTVGYRRNDIE